MAVVYLSLGSSLGNKEQNLYKAEELLNNTIGCISKKSSYYETAPWGFDLDTTFLNSVVCIETNLLPLDLLNKLLSIEKEMGRIRHSKTVGYSSRIIDIDILFYDDIVIKTERLCIPHALLHLRRFVLIPFIEIDKDFKHPVLHNTMLELLNMCEDKEGVVLIK